MPSFKLSTFLHFLFSISLSSTEAAIPTYVFDQCSNRTTFTVNSTYQANLNAVLDSLSSTIAAGNSTTYNTGFYSTYYGTPGQSLDMVYGRVLCRGDVNTSTCNDCVNFAINGIFEICPVQKETIIFYEECLLRYSNRSLFFSLEPFSVVSLLNTQDISGLSHKRFDQLVNSMMNDAATEASNSIRKFAVKKVNLTASQWLYGLVQCTPDLSSADCNSCFRQLIGKLPSCCSGKRGGRVLARSCIVRYEIYSFFNESFITTPASLAPVLLPPPPPGSVTRPKGKGQTSTTTIVAIVTPIAVSMVLFVMGYCFLVRRARRKNYNTVQEDDAGNGITTVDSLQFDFATFESATNNFSYTNKLGEGGFGPVYKGTLPNGQEIAVKRLSRSSRQGAEEFKNEVVLVAKLQHRNLVRLLGFCLEREEKILVYEYVPNKSLDYFLFDPEKQEQLDWSRRYKIIGGIARGILYLHEDSRLKVIHRDLKASNILLDGDMNVKISDFGLARIFNVDQTQGSTNRIVGTYGYMSPEYGMHGQFSGKSDVYSFGVLVFEIIIGKKNSSFYQTNGTEYLLSYAWKLWRDGTPLRLLDSTLGDSYSRNEVIRCIHIALLCAQEDPADRPTMATVVLMLNNYSLTLPEPQEPAFFIRSRPESEMPTKGLESNKSTTKSMPSLPYSVNEVSITEVCPR